MSDRTAVEHRREDLKQGIVDRGATLLARLEGIPQVQTEVRGAGRTLRAAGGTLARVAAGTRPDLCLLHFPNVSRLSTSRIDPAAVVSYQGLQNVSSPEPLERRARNTPISIP